MMNGAAGPRAMLPALGREVAGEFKLAAAREWLVTNGTGSFASGTVAGVNTRRYHGLLIASLDPPVNRVLMLASLDTGVDYRGARAELQTHQFADGTVHPQGFLHIESFSIECGMPTWRYAIADALLEKQIFMDYGRDTTYVVYRCLRASAPLELTLRPLCAYRDYHHQNRGRRPFNVERDGDGIEIEAHADARTYRLRADGARFEAAADWYWNFEHCVERERGLDSIEDLYSPGTFRLELKPGEAKAFIASAEGEPPLATERALRLALGRAGDLTQMLPRSTVPWVAQLALAADQFIVKRGADGVTLIAGYPWFTDWGRDTMIALPGLTSTLGRHATAAAILRTFARHVDRGMLPNRFPDQGESAEYNTVDATLWFFEAVSACLRAAPDAQLGADLYPVLLAIVKAHVAGTRYGIGLDAADGLLRAGVPGVQLTWMDAKIGDWVVTPRSGKAVEINALWLNALNVTRGLAAQLNDGEGELLCRELLRKGSAGFVKFWSEEHGHLYDVIEDERGGADASLRPNQLFAISLPYSALDQAQMRAVVDACGRELLTSYGLRSLARNDPRYIGRYEGDPVRRDSAYHQGTVWPWLLGPYALANYRVYGDARRAQTLLEPLAQHLMAGCVGSISEIIDGDAPYGPRGCIAQAWSVAEILRVWLLLEQAAGDSHSAGIFA